MLTIRRLASTCAICAAILATSPATAGTIILEDGTILGINNVELGTALYDVEFVDGTCIDLFSGCDGAEDFPFSDSRDAQDPQSAIAAALAIEAILHPPGVGILGRAAGCDAIATSCEIMTLSFVDGSAVHASITLPDPGSLGTAPLLQFVDPANDLSQDPFKVYARWTLVPEPSTALLIGLGLCGLCSTTSRPRRQDSKQARRSKSQTMRIGLVSVSSILIATAASGQSYFSTTTGTEGKAISPTGIASYSEQGGPFLNDDRCGLADTFGTFILQDDPALLAGFDGRADCNGVSDPQEIVGNVHFTGPSEQLPVIYNPSTGAPGVLPLVNPALPFGDRNNGEARDISANGLVVVGEDNVSSISTQGVKWVGAALTPTALAANALDPTPNPDNLRVSPSGGFIAGKRRYRWWRKRSFFCLSADSDEPHGARGGGFLLRTNPPARAGPKAQPPPGVIGSVPG